VKAHDDALHRPYDPGVIRGIASAVAELNDGAASPRRTGRLAIDVLVANTSSEAWRRRAEVLEQHIGVLVEQKSDLEAALHRLRRERDLATADRERLRHGLAEAEKEIDVLRGIRDALRAELIKAQPSRRTTGLLAEVAKAAAAAAVGAVVSVGAQHVFASDDLRAHAVTVVEHADVVIADCGAGNGDQR
jgi:chromosome segregation ATPase